MRSQLLQFLVAGAIGFVVDTGVLYAALALGFGFFAGRVFSFLSAVWVTWRINRRYAFASSRQKSLLHEWLRYLIAMSAGGAVNYAAYSAAVLALPHLPVLPMVAVGVGSLAGMAFNFASAKWWVYRHRQ